MEAWCLLTVLVANKGYDAAMDWGHPKTDIRYFQML